MERGIVVAVTDFLAKLRLSGSERVFGALALALAGGMDTSPAYAGYLARNPARPAAVRGPRQTKPDIRPFRSWAQVEAVAEQADDYGALIRFACATGLRPEEWAALTWADVDFPARTAAVNKVWTKGDLRSSEGKTEAAFRVVSLQQPALAALRSLPRPLQSDRLIFAAPNGGHLNLDNWRRRVWKKAMDRSGLEYRPLYQMRHTFATLALAAGLTSTG